MKWCLIAMLLMLGGAIFWVGIDVGQSWEHDRAITAPTREELFKFNEMAEQIKVLERDRLDCLIQLIQSAEKNDEPNEILER